MINNSITKSSISSSPAVIAEGATASTTPKRSVEFKSVDTFEGASSRSAYTPATNAWMDTVENPSRPVSERLTNLLLTPVVLPIVATIDVLTMPFTAIGLLFKK